MGLKKITIATNSFQILNCYQTFLEKHKHLTVNHLMIDLLELGKATALQL